MTARRQFIQWIPVVGLAAMTARHAHAQAKLDEKDPQAVALGYVHDAGKADKAKYKNYAAGQNCGNCQLYQGKDAEWGGCPLFQGKQVAKAGWCSAYAKKT
ncbi:MAG TPA: high-potential iron-sulfur protein [Methylibium sp.]|uniref:high-potential iron-sulfur protein n=1 Tax=Methylibium sp. TaxID=2067992 RepID=UPI002DBFE242|nr:high-potential iron-sulfur protein [Methylibium sp.]HEU4457739.1 high-potential iron-sulfur protein [Methylibium sp.]